MLDHSQSFASLMYPRQPTCPNARILLFAMRRMAVFGLHDAHATNLFFSHFRLGYRRPLILLRALVAELSRASRRPITVAPCCCQRVTNDEMNILLAIAAASEDPRASHSRVSLILDRDDCLGTVTSAQAVGTAFADLGRPILIAGDRSSY